MALITNHFVASTNILFKVQYVFAKHLEKFLGVFREYLITMNISPRKEGGLYYAHSLRVGRILIMPIIRHKNPPPPM
jgi:hypothetical protein